MSFVDRGVHTFAVVAILGAAIPGSDLARLTPGRRLGALPHTVTVQAIDSTRVFRRDTVYELQGTVLVGPGATLVIEAGTRIEGDPATRGALVVGIGGNLVARGTLLEPIVFTCSAAVKTPGCWGGVAIAGLAPLNNGTIVSGHVECPVKTHPAIPGDYGGCLQQDSSGALTYVRIEYGGMAPPGGLPVPALALLGVGSGTEIEAIQVHGSLGDALFVSGGYVDLRNLVLTAPGADALEWNDGWHGRAQFVLAQLENGTTAGVGIRGSNVTAGAMIGTRSDPRLSHVTIVGSPASPAGILLENGTAARIANAIVLGTGGPGLDIQGTEACDQANGAAMPGIEIDHSFFSGNTPDYSADADCVDEAAYASAAARGNRLIDPLLVAAAGTIAPDLRPAATSPALTGYTMLPPDGFFDLSIQYVGAVAPATGAMGNIPWYAGWTRGWTDQP